MEVKPNGSEPRVENFPKMRVEILPGEGLLPKIQVLDLPDIPVDLFLILSQDLALLDKHVQHPPVLGIAAGDEPDFRLGLTRVIGAVEIDVLQHFLAQGIPVRPNELAEIPAY